MDLKLPDLGEGVLEGEIVKWLVKPGDKVSEDQVVLEIMTDKATVEIPVKAHGTVEALLAKEGDLVKVGQTILKVTGSSGASTATAKVTHTPHPESKVHTQPQAQKPAPQVAAPNFTNADVQAAPAVRKLARDMGIDLGTVRGSGPHGRILIDDLTRSQAGGGGAAARTWAPTGGVRGQRNEDHVPVRGLRRKIIEKMATSKRTAAHFTYVEECDVTELAEFRQKLKPKAEAAGVKITFMPFILKATVIGLKEFPQLNATLIEENGQPTEIVYKKYYNLGVAVDTDDGLTVPVVKDADCKGIFELAAEIASVSQKARDKKLSPAELQEGTFTITNAGNIGGLLATPVINYPEVAIMGVHQIKKRPVVIGNEIKIRDIMYLSISLDHRVVDGAVAARFMNRVVALLSDPKLLMAELMGSNF